MRLTLCFGLIFAALHVVSAQTPVSYPKIEVSKLGPQVGDKVPDFSLPDQTGQIRTLSSVMGPKGLMLVFFRSADW